MGNPLSDAEHDSDRVADIDNFYSSNSWIEGKAVVQLDLTAKLRGVQKIAAFPDLHPGKYGPVGCAILADRIYPHLIGNDIGCGISVFLLDLSARKIRVDKAAQKLRALEGSWNEDPVVALKDIGLRSTLHDVTLGSIGGGNHFCELQAVDEIFDEAITQKFGLTKDSALLMVHSGSRSFGTEVFGTIQNHVSGLEAGSDEALIYLERHFQAVKWATLNRRVIAARAADALRSSCRLITDAPHNLIETAGEFFLHRKGAAKANLPLVPLAGSRDALSFLLKPTDQIHTALESLAHGAGRKYDRRSMSGRVGSTRLDREKLERTSFGGRVVCEDRRLLLEEAPGAYKDSQAVVDDLSSHGLATKVAALKPLVTYKKAFADQQSERQEKHEILLQRRRDR